MTVQAGTGKKNVGIGGRNNKYRRMEEKAISPGDMEWTIQTPRREKIYFINKS